MSKQQEPPRVLPADVYDTLEFAALAFGGIGGGRYTDTVEYDAERDAWLYAPVCAIGFGRVINGDYDYQPLDGDESLEMALRAVGISEGTNDAAVMDINVRLGVADPEARVPFKKWAKELNVVRGDA